MARALFALSLLLTALPVLAEEAVSADAIVGQWATEPTENGFAHVEIARTGDTYSGAIVWLKKPTYDPGDPGGMAGKIRVDRENPDPSLRSRPIIGLQILHGFTYVGDGEWKNGTIYDPESGKTYRCRIRLMADGRLKVRGFIGISLLGRTAIWRPATAADSGGTTTPPGA